LFVFLLFSLREGLELLSLLGHHPLCMLVASSRRRKLAGGVPSWRIHNYGLSVLCVLARRKTEYEKIEVAYFTASPNINELTKIMLLWCFWIASSWDLKKSAFHRNLAFSHRPSFDAFFASSLGSSFLIFRRQLFIPWVDEPSRSMYIALFLDWSIALWWIWMDSRTRVSILFVSLHCFQVSSTSFGASLYCTQRPFSWDIALKRLSVAEIADTGSIGNFLSSAAGETPWKKAHSHTRRRMG